MAPASKAIKSTRQGPPGISGKRLTGWVLLALAVIGISLSYTLWTYNRLDAARRNSAGAWRDVTEHLAARYRAAERSVANGVDSRELNMEFGEQFRLAVDSFRTTSLPEQQIIAAERVEKLLATDEAATVSASLENISDAAQGAIAGYNRAREQEKQLLDSWGGRLLDVFLKFESPHPFVVGAPKVGN